MNRFGRYTCTLPDRIAVDELRPLRTPASWEERLAKFS